MENLKNSKTGDTVLNHFIDRLKLRTSEFFLFKFKDIRVREKLLFKVFDLFKDKAKHDIIFQNLFEEIMKYEEWINELILNVKENIKKLNAFGQLYWKGRMCIYFLT